MKALHSSEELPSVPTRILSKKFELRKNLFCKSNVQTVVTVTKKAKVCLGSVLTHGTIQTHSNCDWGRIGKKGSERSLDDSARMPPSNLSTKAANGLYRRSLRLH